jgi:PleD family two-component response regulator
MVEVVLFFDMTLPSSGGNAPCAPTGPETGIDGVMSLAENIRFAIEEFSFPTVGTVTISAGFAERIDKINGTALIEKADRALYSAKKRGRNRVEIASP